MTDDQPSRTDDAPTTVADLEPGALYTVVRRAVEDALLDVIGTLLLVGVGFVILWFGVTVAVTDAGGSIARPVGGAVVALVGAYLVADALGLVPSVIDRI